MKKVLKWLGLIVLGLIAVMVVAVLIISERKPEGQTGPEAEALAQKMMLAVNKPAWDTTKVLQWTFRGEHDYIWDKERNFVQVNWEDIKVLLHTKTKTGKVWEGQTELTGEDAAKLLEMAWSFFCNDSFWLNPVVKAFDPGTSRSIVTTNEGKEALMVSYSSGGVTPGDSYLWLLDETGLPNAWKMWVKIIPIGGFGTTWENWIDLSTGAKVATKHVLSIGEFELTNIKAAMQYSEIGIEDPFGPISN